MILTKVEGWDLKVKPMIHKRCESANKGLFELASGSPISTDKGSRISTNGTNCTTVRTRFLLTLDGQLIAAIACILLLTVYFYDSTNVPPEIQLVLTVPLQYLLPKSTILYRSTLKAIEKLRKFQSNIYKMSFIICTSLSKIIDLNAS